MPLVGKLLKFVSLGVVVGVFLCCVDIFNMTESSLASIPLVSVPGILIFCPRCG